MLPIHRDCEHQMVINSLKLFPADNADKADFRRSTLNKIIVKNKTPKKVFVDGPIPPEKISKSIASHSTKLDIDGHSIFLAQVQQVQEDGSEIEGIEFSTDVEKAEAILYEIREDTFSKFSLTCMHIYHSLGLVKPGELYLFIFTSSTNRAEAINACDYLVSRIKSEVSVKRHRA